MSVQSVPGVLTPETACYYPQALPPGSGFIVHQGLERPAKAHRQHPLSGTTPACSDQDPHIPPYPGSVSSEDTTSSSWSLQKTFPTSPAGYLAHLSTAPHQALMSDGYTSRGGTRGPDNAVQHRTSSSIGSHDPACPHTYLHRYLRDQRGFDENDHAIWVLMWLSFLDPFMSFFSAIFALVSAILFIAISPFSFCHPSISTSTAIIRTVAPVFRCHLRLMCAPSVEDVHTFDFKAGRLVLTQVVSAFLTIGIAIAAWIAAAFWLFELTLGNPDGSSERGGDGKAAVLGVRNWWERFHLYSINER